VLEQKLDDGIKEENEEMEQTDKQDIK